MASATGSSVGEPRDRPGSAPSSSYSLARGEEAAINVWHGAGENADLSNLAARPFVDKHGRPYISVEHAYQTLKSGSFDQTTYGKYTSAGRKISGALGTKTSGGWNLRLMKQIVAASFQQNAAAAARLVSTGSARLTHTQDRGVWRAEFPRILSEVRDELIARLSADTTVDTTAERKIERKIETKIERIYLSGTGPYVRKDQSKADKATKFIGRGSDVSSTARYAKDFGVLANSGRYMQTDIVFVSAEGARRGRSEPDFAELDAAVAARATFITDNPADRARSYNTGERQIAKYLVDKGYTERAPGVWVVSGPHRGPPADAGDGRCRGR